MVLAVASGAFICWSLCCVIKTTSEKPEKGNEDTPVIVLSCEPSHPVIYFPY